MTDAQMSLTTYQFNTALSDACVIEITSTQLVLEQLKDKKGVCIIPQKQDKAARKIIKHLGREVTEIEGSKRGTLRYTFSPPLSNEELSKYEDASC